MSDRLGDVRARIGATKQLETVVTAMRGIAAARAREARGRLEGVRAYANALGEAISVALTLTPESRTAPRPADGHVVLAFCAEHGFAGAFSERVLTAAKHALVKAARGETELFLVGDRGATLATEQGLKFAWSSPMAAHVEEAPALADRIADALYDTLDADQTTRVTLIHSVPETQSGTRIVERPLIPLDLARFPLAPSRVPPLVTLPPRELIAGLAREYVFAELCEAVVLSFAAENEARMQAMIAVRGNVHKSLDELTGRYRRLRQEQITEEIIELAMR